MKKIGIYSSIVTIILILDQLTKKWAESALKGQRTQEYLGGLFKLIYAENRGAWGSFGSDYSEFWRYFLLIILPVGALIALTIFLFKSKKLKTWDYTAYSLILSGGVGNLIDRILYDYVIDFLYIGYRGIGTNIFNIADMVIMAGFIMLILDGIVFKNKKVHPTEMGV